MVGLLCSMSSPILKSVGYFYLCNRGHTFIVLNPFTCDNLNHFTNTVNIDNVLYKVVSIIPPKHRPILKGEKISIVVSKL